MTVAKGHETKIVIFPQIRSGFTDGAAPVDTMDVDLPAVAAAAVAALQLGELAPTEHAGPAPLGPGSEWSDPAEGMLVTGVGTVVLLGSTTGHLVLPVQSKGEVGHYTWHQHDMISNTHKMQKE